MEATASTIQSESLVSQRTGLASSLGWRRIKRTRHLMLLLPWVGLAWQGVLAQTSADWISAVLAASGAFLIVFDALRPQRLYRYPLSTLVVLGFGVTLQVGPLLFTAFEGNTLTYNLKVPVATFGHGVLASLVSIIAHRLYRKERIFNQVRGTIQQGLLQLRIFAPLAVKETLFMGALGVAAYAVGPLVVEQVEAGNVFLKLLEGFRFLATIPVAFFLYALTGGRHGYHEASTFPRVRFAWFVLIFYTLALVVVGLLRNSRSTFIFPLSCLALGLALYWLFGLLRFRSSSFVAFVLAVVVGLPLLTDLASAMVITRNLRGDLPPFALVEQTLQQMEDRSAIKRFNREVGERGLVSDWSENYVSNVFLARFANAKFPDNSLENESRLTSASRDEMLLFHWHRLISTFPAPALRLVGVSDQIKAEATSVSFGDKLYSLATGSAFSLGGFRTGHFFGTGLAAFDAFYIAWLFVGFLMLFPLVDSHALIRLDSEGGPPLISAVAITQLIGWFIVSNSESVVNLLSFPLRGFLEPVVLFALVRWIARPLRLV
jgi:hypothetical protein